MMADALSEFDLRGRVAVITGGTGVLGSALAAGLCRAGVQVAVIGRNEDRCTANAVALRDSGGRAIGVSCDVLDRDQLASASDRVERELGPIDLLVNAAGGNRPQATTSPERSFFDLDDAFAEVIDLNLMGTVRSCQVFGRAMAERSGGCIVNIASMTAYRPLTKVPAYGAAKAAVTNFTQWLAVHMATEYSPKIRVNALAPGFFLTEQNRFLLIDEQTGTMTARGRAILDHTPAGRLGDPADLIGALIWLASPASAFVTGIVVPVDGGFSAFGGL
jgi:NAD(P)-dependent dehydrogenase (short-subunit alcohol dehydrogenase family)